MPRICHQLILYIVYLLLNMVAVLQPETHCFGITLSTLIHHHIARNGLRYHRAPALCYQVQAKINASAYSGTGENTTVLNKQRVFLYQRTGRQRLQLLC